MNAFQSVFERTLRSTYARQKSKPISIRHFMYYVGMYYFITNTDYVDITYFSILGAFPPRKTVLNGEQGKEYKNLS